MKYNIKAHKTKYKNVLFRSRLEARWAAFFDIIGWSWTYEPIDLVGWTPDFFVSWPCGHSECSGSHSLAVEIKPYFCIEEFDWHPCMDYPYGVKCTQNEITGIWDEKWIPADGSAGFGIDPTVSQFEISHGAGGGIFDVGFFCRCDMDLAWKRACLAVRFLPEK